MNKGSETNKSKDNSSGAANSGNNKNKHSKHKKKDHQSNTNSSANKNSSDKCTYCGQDGQFTIKCFKNLQVKSSRGKTANWTGVKKCQLN